MLREWVRQMIFATIPSHNVYSDIFISFGDIECTGLSNGARIGIAIAVFVVASILLVALAYYRRRRARNQNLVYIVSPGAGGQPYNPYGAPAGYPQYPPQAYGEQAYTNYAPPSNYAPSSLGANKGYVSTFIISCSDCDLMLLNEHRIIIRTLPIQAHQQVERNHK